MNKRYMSTICLGLVLLMLLSGCSGSKFPTGTYVKEVGSDILIFTSDGEFETRWDTGMNKGTFTIRGNELTWDTDKYCEAIGMHNNATYILTLENNILSFELKGADTCSLRVAYRSNYNWLK